ncbi:hypothetical protein HPB49_003099 [Dermacentor silvarum]|uniref:Uncharacterized protein n=1 Tax=Dermacentor silvarum TaxID=543639 RepID=A0ACB8DAJ4_DERSI|nr:hypothetical protein HPB49_003099 [Dermacentor silvarum]
MRDAPLEVEQQQDDVRTKTDVSSTAIYAKTEAALQHSSEDVTNASGGETAGPEQALKPKEIEGSSGDSTSSQNEPSLTGLVHKRTTISLQVPGADKYEQSFEGKIHVRLNPPLPFQPSTQASLETVSQDSSGEATPVELTTNTATQQSLNKQGSSTERSSSKDVDASDTFAKLSEKKVLPQEVESPKSSEEHLPFKATVDTNAHFKAEASIQDPESPTTMLFGPPSDTEKEQTEDRFESLDDE